MVDDSIQSQFVNILKHVLTPILATKPHHFLLYNNCSPLSSDISQEESPHLVRIKTAKKYVIMAFWSTIAEHTSADCSNTPIQEPISGCQAIHCIIAHLGA